MRAWWSPPGQGAVPNPHPNPHPNLTLTLTLNPNPNPEPDQVKEPSVLNVVVGVNDDKLTSDHVICTAASCTTNCIAPVIKVLIFPGPNPNPNPNPIASTGPSRSSTRSWASRAA